MKRFNNLFTKIYDMNNIEIAHKNARKGKRHYREVKMVDAEPDKYFEIVHNLLKNKTFQNSEYTKIQRVMDNGKVRDIAKLPYFPDRIIHHAIMQIVEPIWRKTLIKDTYACIKNRGIHKCLKRIQQALRDGKTTKYCLKMDVKKYYPSVNNDILKQIVRKKIKDKDLLWLLDEIINSEVGIPIGNYLSQYFGNLYLSGFDHWMKEKQKCKFYYRYCDDIVILHSSKKELHRIRKKADQYLNNTLKLQMKSNWQVFPVDKRGIDFLGYKFYHGYTLLRKSIAKRFESKMRKLAKDGLKLKSGKVINSVMSYYGWMKHANCRNLMNEYIDKEIFWIVKQKSKEANISNPLQGVI